MIKIIIYDDRYEVRTLEIGELLGTYSRSDYRLIHDKEVNLIAIVNKSSMDLDTSKILAKSMILVSMKSCIIIRENDRDN
jgi:hypothetical protein